MIHDAKAGHPGGSLSSVEIMLTLYFHIMNHSPEDPERDRFVLSKGHAAPLLYTVLMEAGYIPHDQPISLENTAAYFKVTRTP